MTDDPEWDEFVRKDLKYSLIGFAVAIVCMTLIVLCLIATVLAAYPFGFVLCAVLTAMNAYIVRLNYCDLMDPWQC